LSSSGVREFGSSGVLEVLGVLGVQEFGSSVVQKFSSFGSSRVREFWSSGVQEFRSFMVFLKPVKYI
jgi:hypothetical protein